MRWICVLVLVLYAPQAVAHVPVFPVFETQRDVHHVADPTLMQMFFGELTNFPHTYEFTSRDIFILRVATEEPVGNSGKENIGSIIIKIPEKKARVEEVVRLPAPQEWVAYFDSMTGESYKRGNFFEKELPPGTYRIEVHTPNNLEQYVLKIGTRDEMTIGYIELLKRLIQVQHFFGDTFLGILMSSYVYLPMLFLFLCSYVGYRVWRKWYTERII